MKYRFVPTALVLSTITLVSASGFAVAKESVEKPMSSVVETVVNDGWSSNDNAVFAAQTGQKIVKNLTLAHEAIEEGKSDKALRYTLIASRLDDVLLPLMPHAKIKTDLFNAKGKLAMSENDVFYDDLLPIYAELDAIEAVAPEKAKKARSKVSKAEKLAKSGKTAEAAKTMDEAIAMVSETEIFLPVVYVHGQLEAALGALTKEPQDINTAKKAIDNALESLTAVTAGDVAEAPVTKPGK